MLRREVKNTKGDSLSILSKRWGITVSESDMTEDDTISISLDIIRDNKELIDEMCKNSWDNFSPKKRFGISADYDEYYDTELDRYAYCWLQYDKVNFGRPKQGDKKIYQFNKLRAESLYYDIFIKEF